MALKLERIYDKPADTDGYRILVDRLWPRGISKVNAKLDEWEKEIAPTKKLRSWFSHDPEKFPDFKTKYIAELDQNEKTAAFISQIADKLKTGNVILLYGAKDREHNQAVVLKTYIEDHLGQAWAIFASVNSRVVMKLMAASFSTLGSPTPIDTIPSALIDSTPTMPSSMPTHSSAPNAAFQ